MAWTTPVTWTYNQLPDEDDFNEQLRDNLTWLYDNLPQRATLEHLHSIVTSGASIGFTVNASQAHNGYAIQGSASNGNSWTTSLVLAAGEYTLTILAVTANDEGKLDLVLDGTTISSGLDFYSAGTTYNVKLTVSGIVVATGGRCVLTGTVNGKNGSSSDHKIRITTFNFWPSAGDS